MRRRVELRGFLARRPLGRSHLYYIPCNVLFESDFERLLRYRILRYRVAPLMTVDELSLMIERRPYTLGTLHKYGIDSIAVIADNMSELLRAVTPIAGLFKIAAIYLGKGPGADVPGVEIYKYFYSYREGEKVSGLVVSTDLYVREKDHVRRVDYDTVVKNIRDALYSKVKLDRVGIIVDILDREYL
ncbi:MAG: hypothetical protein GXO23_01660 [Crenarchaeota archaeon]|nr:hypothetical protein [Thermoproteota archaeon]